MRISEEKKNKIIKAKGYFYIKTKYPGWVTTYDVGFSQFENEDVLNKQIEEFGYNMFFIKRAS